MTQYNFIKEEYLGELGINAKEYKHIKSGARVLTLKCDDDNKTFLVGFRTPPVDDTGVPHILEHSTLCGSKKYPVKDPFVELLKSSLNTFLNAMTYPDKTVYPVASCNLKDFKNLMDVYLDAVFYPKVYDHEEIFKQEGWRYELQDKDQDIVFNGVVYNEMKGSFSNSEARVELESFRTLFPDTTYSFESGGDPKYIPSLTYKEFLDFHKKYYSPSNSYIIIYGDLDMDERLEYLDKEYLSKFDIVDVDSEIKLQKPFDKMHIEKIDYPISKDSSLEDKTYYTYNVCLGSSKDKLLSSAFSIIEYSLLDIPGAPLKQALLDSKIGKDVDGTFEDGILQPILNITIKESKDNMENKFLEVITSTLKKIKDEGIDKKTLLSAINYLEFKYREADFGGLPKGLVYSIQSLSTWLYDDNDSTSKLELGQIFEELRKKIDTNYYEELIDKYILNNPHSSLVIASPSKTLLEEEESKVKEILKEYKASLSEEELDALILSTKKQKEFSGLPSSKEDLEKLPRLSRSDIGESKDLYINELKEIDGVKIVEHNILTNGIGYLKLLFDASYIDDSLYKYMPILSTLLLMVDTSKYSYTELAKEINLNTGGINTSVSNFTNYDNDEVHPYISVDARFLYKREKFVFDVIKDVILTSSFDNKNRVKELLQEKKIMLENMIMSAGHIVSYQRALSYIDKAGYFNDLFSGISLYELIKDILSNYDDKYEPLKSSLLELMKALFRKDNLIISYTGDECYYRDYIKEFKDSLNNSLIEKHEFIFKKNIKKEAFKTPGQVQYVSKVGLVDKAKYSGHMLTLNLILGYEYLYVKVRVLGGAYGVFSTPRRGSIIFSSYRDPKLKETLDVYDDVPNFIDSLDYTEDQITQFIIGTIGQFDSPLTRRQLGDVSFNAYLSHISNKLMKKTRDEIINTKLEDLKALKPIYKDLFNQNVYCVLGNENVIESNKELFDNIVNILE